MGQDLLWTQAAYGPAVEHDVALTRLQQADDGGHDGGLARAVGSDDAGDRAFLDDKLDASEYVASTVAGIDSIELQQHEIQSPQIGFEHSGIPTYLLGVTFGEQRAAVHDGDLVA